MSPPWRVPGIRSFSRLTDRRKVDLPHPDGPMIAVTAFRSMEKFRSRSTCRVPYEKLKSLTSTAGDPRRAPGCAGGRGVSVARGVGMNPGCTRGAAVIRISP